MSPQQVDAIYASFHAEKQQRQHPSYEWPGLMQSKPVPPQLPQLPQLPQQQAAAKPATGFVIHEDPPSPSEASHRPIPLPKPEQQQPLGSGYNRSNIQRPPARTFQPKEPQPLPDRTTSTNPFINGSAKWQASTSGALCVDCGETGHGSRNCPNNKLPAWERSYLKSIVFGGTPQANAIEALNESFTPGSSTVSSQVSSVSAYVPGTPRVNSITWSISDLRQPAQVNAAKANLGEGSAPNKRLHSDEPL